MNWDHVEGKWSGANDRCRATGFRGVSPDEGESVGTTPATRESQGEASEHRSMRLSPRTSGELSSCERFGLLGWDEV